MRDAQSSGAAMRIDAHIHLIGDTYRAELERAGALPYPLPPWSRDATLAFMDRYGIDAAVMSPSPPGPFVGDRERTCKLARVCNEETAALVASDPRRFAGLAILPLPFAQDALAELDHALDVLGLDGVLMLSNVVGTYPGDPSCDEVLAALDRRAAYVFLHPVEPVTASPMPAMPPWLQEFPFDTTRAVVDLIYSGALERHRNIKLQIAHLGGAAPFLAHRIASLAARDPKLAARAPAGARAYLSRLFYDTGLSDDEVAFEAVRATAGFEQIVFGSDWPYLAQPETDAPDPGLAYLDADERRRLHGENVAALVPRLVTAQA